MENELDQQRDAQNGFEPIEEVVIEISSIIGKRERAWREQISAMDKILCRLRWNRPIKVATTIPPCPPPTVYQSSSAWKAAVQRKHQDVQELHSRHIPTDAHQNMGCRKAHILMDDVSLIDKSYLEKKCKSPKWKNTIDDIVSEFSLNRDQERAFCIVANHACNSGSEQLKMYIGSMGGTGKSQVLKAVIKLFEAWNESHRFVVVAPTGSAAALLGGSTYHSMFGINDHDGGDAMLAQIKARLVGVEYIFLDEVSMLSCLDLFRLSLRMIQITGDNLSPFGGLNMIVAGDFAQLPPPIGRENASLYSRTIGARSNVAREQHASIGKAFWHQITTIVILRENMRQRTQSRDDTRLREALSNMRYKACTAADIAFLRSRISSENPDRSSVNQTEFRNVSIITAWNTHKDSINTIGSRRFATENKETLTDFYSEDRVPTVIVSDNKKDRKIIRKRKFQSIPDDIQRLLWDAPHGNVSDFIPGKLSLCLDLLVMIWANAATELCITKVQEATVYAWQSGLGLQGQHILDTLFVKLTNPPQNMQFDGLPQNVVPLVPKSNTVKCNLPDDTSICISRTQVEVLPNFSMTDYASQGKTHIYNVVDLNNLSCHQAYYTALSQSASAAGTLILQGFDPKMITGGAAGALRQEFRNLEILDDITWLRYESKLPKCVVGEVRCELVKTYRKWKGDNFVPPTVHSAIRWKKNDPFLEDSIEDVIEDITPDDLLGILPDIANTTPVDTISIPRDDKEGVEANRNDSHEVEAAPWAPSTPKCTKRKVIESESMVPPRKRRQRLPISPETPTRNTHVQHEIIPRGLEWERQSCTFDAVLTPIYNMWRESPRRWSEKLQALNAGYLGSLATNFELFKRNVHSLEKCREILREKLQIDRPHTFTIGRETGIHILLQYLLTTPLTVYTAILSCPSGHGNRRGMIPHLDCLLNVMNEYGSLQNALAHGFESPMPSMCDICLVPQA